jgi:hypothetical protein
MLTRARGSGTYLAAIAELVRGEIKGFDYVLVRGRLLYMKWRQCSLEAKPKTRVCTRKYMKNVRSFYSQRYLNVVQGERYSFNLVLGSYAVSEHGTDWWSGSRLRTDQQFELILE